MNSGLEPSAGTAAAFHMGGGGTHTHSSRRSRVLDQNNSKGFFGLIATCESIHFRDASRKDVPRGVPRTEIAVRGSNDRRLCRPS